MTTSEGAVRQLEQDPDERAWDYVREERFRDALEAFNVVVGSDPNNSEALYGQALCLRELDRKDEAQSKLDDVLEQDARYARFLEKEALIYIRKEQYDKAIEPFVLAKDKEALQRMIVSLRTWRRPEEEVEKITEVEKIIAKVQKIIEAALKRFDDPGIRSESGWLYYTHEQYDKAIENFDEVLQSASLFRVGELPDPAALTLRLFDRQNPISKYLRTRFNPDTQRLLEDYAEGKDDNSRPLPETLRGTLIDNLNQLLKGPSLFDESRFGRVELRPHTRRLIAQNPQGADLIRLNRLLLEDAYPREIRKSPDNESAIQGKIASLRLKRNFSKAYDLLQTAVEKYPEHFGFQSERGWLYFDQIQYHRALMVFETNYGNGDESALQWIISCLRSQRNFTEAEKWLPKALTKLKENDPAWIGILIEEGWLHFDKKRYNEALSVFEEALDKVPSHEFALQGKIASLRKLDRFEEADKLIKESLKQHRTSTGILSERGWLFFERRKYGEADASFAAAIKLAPSRLGLKLSRVEVLTKMNRSHEVENIFKGLKKDFPGDVEVTERLGRFYLHQNDWKRAEEEFLSIVRKDPENILGLNGLGAVYVKQDRYEEAITNFRKVLQKDEKNPTWHTNLAWALVRQDDGTRYSPSTLKEAFVKKALQPMKQRWRREQENSSSLSPLDEAEEQCEKALEYDPESADAFACLGTIAFKRGKLLDSEGYLQTSREKDPKEGSYVGLGALYVHMGQYDKAEETLNETIEHDPDDAPAHIELGNLYLQTGKIKEAIQKFRRALAIDQNDDDAPRALAIALMQADKLSEAETVIRDALRRLDESKRWRLHLTRSQLLTQRGDESGDSQYYDEALKEVNKAIMLEHNHADPYFQAGFIRCKLKDYDGALKNFRSCRSKDKDHPDAELNYMRVQTLIQKERARTRGTFWGGFIVGALAVVQLSLLWYFFKQGKVTETILTVMIPILLGLVVVAFLIPVLIKLKLPGLEAELSERKEPVSSGPKGEIGFISSPPTISSGPR